MLISSRMRALLEALTKKHIGAETAELFGAPVSNRGGMTPRRFKKELHRTERQPAHHYPLKKAAELPGYGWERERASLKHAVAAREQGGAKAAWKVVRRRDKGRNTTKSLRSRPIDTSVAERWDKKRKPREAPKERGQYTSTARKPLKKDQIKDLKADIFNRIVRSHRPVQKKGQDIHKIVRGIKTNMKDMPRATVLATPHGKEEFIGGRTRTMIAATMGKSYPTNRIVNRYQRSHERLQKFIDSGKYAQKEKDLAAKGKRLRDDPAAPVWRRK